MRRDHHIYGGSIPIFRQTQIHPNFHLYKIVISFWQLGSKKKKKNMAEQRSMPSLLDPGDACPEMSGYTKDKLNVFIHDCW